ncbi:hypothetical protein QTP88_021126 [Uroleucon formosanum]
MFAFSLHSPDVIFPVFKSSLSTACECKKYKVYTAYMNHLISTLHSNTPISKIVCKFLLFCVFFIILTKGVKTGVLAEKLGAIYTSFQTVDKLNNCGTIYVDYLFYDPKKYKEYYKCSSHTEKKKIPINVSRNLEKSFSYPSQNEIVVKVDPWEILRRVWSVFTFQFKCNICGINENINSDDGSCNSKNININMAIVSDTVNTGQGYSQLQEFAATLNMPNIKSSKGECVPGCYRKILHDRLLRLRYAVTEAIKYRQRQLETILYEDNLLKLKKDIINGPSHVFGDHSDCSQYFCEGPKIDEKNYVENFKRLGIWEYITKIKNMLIYHTESLMYNYNNNTAESYNSILAKFLRCNVTVTAYDSGMSRLSLFNKHITTKSPGSFTKRFVKKHESSLYQKRRCRLFCQPSIRSKIKASAGPDQNYGAVLEEINPLENITDAEDTNLQTKFLEKLKLPISEVQSLEKRTKWQHQCVEWHLKRKKRVSYAIAIRMIMFLVFPLLIFCNDFDVFYLIAKLAVARVSSKNKRKLSEENRMFQENWEEEYFVVPNKKGSATCLICRESFILKKYNIIRHYTKKHESFDSIYSPGSLMRK